MVLAWPALPLLSTAPEQTYSAAELACSALPGSALLCPVLLWPATTLPQFSTQPLDFLSPCCPAPTLTVSEMPCSCPAPYPLLPCSS